MTGYQWRIYAEEGGYRRGEMQVEMGRANVYGMDEEQVCTIGLIIHDAGDSYLPIALEELSIGRKSCGNLDIVAAMINRCPREYRIISWKRKMEEITLNHVCFCYLN